MRHRSPLLGLSFALLAACAAQPPRSAESIAAATETPQPHDLINAVVWMQTAAEYQLVTEQVYRMATAQLDRALATPDWDALSAEDRDVPAIGLPPAVIVDVDETVLDNSPFQVRMIRDRTEYDEDVWANWVKEQTAQPVPGAVAFAQAAEARGVTVFYLTNRTAALSEATYENLRKVGFPIKSHDQFLGLGHPVEGCQDHGSEKGCRRKLVGRGHRVLLQVGDQIGDMVNLRVNTPQGREAAIAPYRAWFGERWFVLPNPSYGSWEPALFNNDWSQPAAERRRQKLDALRDR